LYLNGQTLRKPCAFIRRTQGFARAPKCVFPYSGFSRWAAEFDAVFAE
jgi:hypothetical protein